MAQLNTNLNQRVSPGAQSSMVLVTDLALNDSDKTLTVPSGKLWEVMWCSASLATTATVGNRNIRVIVTDGTNEVGRADTDSTQAASATEYYTFGLYGSAAESPATFHWIPFPWLVLPAGFTVRIYDSAAVDAAADDLLISMLVLERPAA
jgi:hypothetical protein